MGKKYEDYAAAHEKNQAAQAHLQVVNGGSTGGAMDNARASANSAQEAEDTAWTAFLDDPAG